MISETELTCLPFCITKQGVVDAGYVNPDKVIQNSADRGVLLAGFSAGGQSRLGWHARSSRPSSCNASLQPFKLGLGCHNHNQPYQPLFGQHIIGINSCQNESEDMRWYQGGLDLRAFARLHLDAIIGPEVMVAST